MGNLTDRYSTLYPGKSSGRDKEKQKIRVAMRPAAVTRSNATIEGRCDTRQTQAAITSGLDVQQQHQQRFSYAANPNGRVCKSM